MLDDDNRLPLTRSLEADVRAAFAVPTRNSDMGLESLLSALAELNAPDTSLTQALSNAGHPQAGSDEQPILDWIDHVYKTWASHYPLAPQLQAIVDQTRPLAAAFALKDERFFIPGGHALHRLLDVIHKGFAGWHSGLGASADKALEGAQEAVARASRDFPSEPQVDGTLELLSQKIEAHAAQLSRLNSTLIEREIATLPQEVGRLATAAAINDLLRSDEIPGSVARFIKSDWYESGVIIASRQGVGSDAWKSFIDTTQLLIDTVQPISPGDSDGQQRLQATMQQLPNTLSRQLLSLQADQDAIAGAVGLIEYALLRNMRGEDLGLMQAEPIMAPGLPDQGFPDNDELEGLGITPGSWFALDTADGEVRLCLAGALTQNIYLLFMDFLGARALRKTSLEFKALLTSGEARPIDIPDSFCRAMVEATESEQQQRAAAREKQEQERQAAEAEALRKQEEMAATFSGQNNPHGAAQASAPPNQHYDAKSDPFFASAQPAQDDRSSVATTQQRDSSSVPSSEGQYQSNTVVKLQIPMGTWIGFHDREPPLLAQVAVRDLEKDTYIFTNREGIKLRELTVSQLIALIDRDMVDVLERKTNFRETVNQMRRDQERLAHS